MLRTPPPPARVALLLGLLALAAPAPAPGPGPGPRGARAVQLDQLRMDLQKLHDRVLNDRNPRRPRMLTFQFYLPREASEPQQLRCLVEELALLEQALELGLARAKDWRAVQGLLSNINATAQELKGPEPGPACDYQRTPVNALEFLSQWVGLCQGLFATAA